MSSNMITLILFGIVLIFLILIICITLKSYVRCPADKIMVIYGKVQRDRPAICKHGGAAFVLPILQDYSFLSLTPFTLNIDLPNALTKLNIRVNITANFTCAISTDHEVMQNAAEHLLNQQQYYINNLATEIIVGQMRLIIATMEIEEFNSQRDKFVDSLQINVGKELKKIGLKLINANITDIRYEGGYLEALAKEAEAIARNNTLMNTAKLNRDYAINSKKNIINNMKSLQNSSEIIPAGSDTDKSDSTMNTNGLSAEILDNSVLLIKSNHSTIAKISLLNQTESNIIGETGSDINARSIDLLSSNSLVIQRNLKDIMRIDFESEQNS